MQESDWEAFLSSLSRTLENGEVTKGTTLLMRRRNGNAWIYRRPTAEEESDYASSEAW